MESENGVHEPREISYSIKEIAVEGYTVTLAGDATNGFVLTNTCDVPPPTTTEPTSEPTTVPSTSPTEPTEPSEPTEPKRVEPDFA